MNRADLGEGELWPKFNKTNIQDLQNHTKIVNYYLENSKIIALLHKIRSSANRNPTENNPKFLKPEIELGIKPKINLKIINEIKLKIQP